jgi:hypothetical protein
MARVATIAPEAEAPSTATAGPERHEIDWEAAESSPEFGELVRRRAFVVPAPSERALGGSRRRAVPTPASTWPVRGTARAGAGSTPPGRRGRVRR